MKIYGFIGDDVDAKNVINEIKLLDGGDDIIIEIDSPGGYTLEGLAICRAIKSTSSKTIAVIDGIAAGMASCVALSCDLVQMPTVGRIHITRTTWIV